MATNSANVAAIISPYQGNIYDVQTKQALAKALIERGLTGGVENYKPAGGGYQYVPQYGIGAGLTQLASALGGALLQKQAGQELSDISARQYAALTGEGQNPTVQSGPTTEQLGAALSGGGGPTNANAANLAQAMGPQTSVQPQRQVAPLAPGGVLNPSGAPTALAYQGYQLDPAGYTAKQLEYYKPADIVAKLRAAGIDPNSMIGQQIVQQNLAKENYIPQQGFAPGQTVFNPATGQSQVIPNVGEGMEVVTRSDGSKMVVPIQGYAGTVRQIESAKAGGKAEFEPISGVDAAGNPIFTTKAAAAQGGGQTQQQPATGRFSGYQAPGGIRPSLSPAEQEGQVGLAKGNVANYNALKDSASNSAERTNILDVLNAYSEGRTKFGPGWTGRIENLASLNSKLPSGFALGGDDVSNAQVVQKLASNLIQQYQKSMGGTGTDKQFELVMHGTPGADMTNKAMQEVIPKLKSMELALQAKANAADNYLAANNNNPSSLNKFETEWRKSYDPRIYQLQMMTPSQRKVFIEQQKDAPALKAKVQTFLNNQWVQ